MDELEEYRNRIEAHVDSRRKDGHRQYDPHGGVRRYIGSVHMKVDLVFTVLFVLAIYIAIHF